MKLNKVLLTLVLSIFVSTGVLASNQDIKITIDGVELQTNVPSKAINNRTMVPMRAIFEAMGANVDWENSTQTATGTKGSDKIILQIGNPKANINGEETTLDSPAVIVNGSTMVPVRFIAESFGADVDWNGETRTVVINNKDNDKVEDKVEKKPDNEAVKYTDEKHFEFDKAKGEITGYKDNAPKDVVIPKTIDGVDVKSIGDEAFMDKKLTSVIIPSEVTHIGKWGFGVNKLTSIIIPKGITEISERAFATNNLTSITMHEGITIIGDCAFLQNNLTSITIPKGVKRIEDGAFSHNYLTSLTIPEGITYVGLEAFAVNHDLTSVTISKGVTGIDDWAFDDVEIIRE